MAVSKRTRYEVLKRDNHTCRYCGATAPDAKIGIDHVVPVTLGGTDDPSNLVAACVDCNAGKSSTAPDAPLVADVQQQAVQWSAAMKVAAERLSKRDEPMRQYIAAIETALEPYKMDGQYAGQYCFDLPVDWRESAVQFYRAGLAADRLEYAIDVAVSRRNVHSRDVWRYACGVAWNMIRELQDEARAILDETSDETCP